LLSLLAKPVSLAAPVFNAWRTAWVELSYLLKSNPKGSSIPVLSDRIEKYWKFVAQCTASAIAAAAHCRCWLSGSNEKRLEAVLLISRLSFYGVTCSISSRQNIGSFPLNSRPNKVCSRGKGINY
jgi:hypothetical protein